jgi:hypothetical protein
MPIGPEYEPVSHLTWPVRQEALGHIDRVIRAASVGHELLASDPSIPITHVDQSNILEALTTSLDNLQKAIDLVKGS